MTTAKSASYDYLIKLLLIGDSGKMETNKQKNKKKLKKVYFQVLARVAYYFVFRMTLLLLPSLQQLVLISRFVLLNLMVSVSSYRFGILLDKRDSVPLQQVSLKYFSLPFFFLTTLSLAYYRGAMGILLVYDTTDERSFGSKMKYWFFFSCILRVKNIFFVDVRNWFSNIEQHASEGVNKILIGNKCDMEDKRVSSLYYNKSKS